MPLSFAVRDAGLCKVIDWSMKGGAGCRPATDAEVEMLARIAELERIVRLLANAKCDVERANIAVIAMNAVEKA